MIYKIDFFGGGDLTGCFCEGPGGLEGCACPIVARN